VKTASLASGPRAKSGLALKWSAYRGRREVIGRLTRRRASTLEVDRGSMQQLEIDQSHDWHRTQSKRNQLLEEHKPAKSRMRSFTGHTRSRTRTSVWKLDRLAEFPRPGHSRQPIAATTFLPIEVRPHVGAALAAGLADKPRPEIGQAKIV